MAAMTHPTPGLYEAALQILGNANSWTQSAVDPMAELVEHLTAEEATMLPSALARVLPLLHGDLERLRFAVEIAARFDLFETAEAIVELAAANRDRQLLLHAAELAANPAVDSSLRQRILDLAEGDRLIRIRLDASTVPGNVDEERLYDQCWPGHRSRPPRFPLPPVVVLDTRLRADLLLRHAVQLGRVGSTVRRYDPAATAPDWFGSAMQHSPRIR